MPFINSSLFRYSPFRFLNIHITTTWSNNSVFSKRKEVSFFLKCSILDIMVAFFYEAIYCIPFTPDPHPMHYSSLYCSAPIQVLRHFRAKDFGSNCIKRHWQSTRTLSKHNEILALICLIAIIIINPSALLRPLLILLYLQKGSAVDNFSCMGPVNPFQNHIQVILWCITTFPPSSTMLETPWFTNPEYLWITSGCVSITLQN